MHMPFHAVTDDQLRAADVIMAVDPNDDGFHQQLFGQHSIPSCRLPGSPPHVIRVLNVELDSTSDELGLLQARVAATRGREMPPSSHQHGIQLDRTNTHRFGIPFQTKR